MKLSVNCVEYMIEDVDEFNQIATIYIFVRDDKWERHVLIDKSFQPYFYIQNKDFGRLRSKAIKRFLSGFTGFRGEDLTRIYTKLPTDVRIMRFTLAKANVPTWEADIKFVLRYLVDRGIREGIDLDPVTGLVKPCEVESRITFWIVDIEVSSPEKKVPDPSRASYPIICLTIYDSKDRSTKTFYVNGSKRITNNFKDVVLISCPDEKSLLEALITEMEGKQPDVFTGWNVYFDLEYIIRRMRRLGVDYNKMSPKPIRLARIRGYKDIRIKGRIVFDALEAYRAIYHRELKGEGPATLGYVGKKELKPPLGKLELPDTIAKVWESDPGKIISYNLRDVEITRRLIDELSLITHFDEIRRISGCIFEDSVYPVRVTDAEALRFNYMKKCLPSKGQWEKKKYKGALIFPVEPQKASNVCEIDLKSSYPNIILAFNLSAETFQPEGEIIIDAEHRFTRKDKGMAPQMLERLMQHRENIYQQALNAKNENKMDLFKILNDRQEALKSDINGMYGVFGYPGYRLYSPIVAEAITLLGRELEAFLEKKIKEWGYTFIYGDTDSVFFILPTPIGKESIDLANKIERDLNEALTEVAVKYNIQKEQPFRVTFKRLYRKFLILTKKRYSGKHYWNEGREDEDYIIKGVETVRSDTSEIGVKVQEEIIKQTLDERVDETVPFLKDIVQEFMLGKIPLQSVGIPSRITKDFFEYKASCSKRACKKKMILKLEEEIYFICPQCNSIKKPPIQIRSAYYSNRFLDTEFRGGSKPLRVWVKDMPEGFPKTDSIAFDNLTDLPDGMVVDWQKMLEATIKAKVEDLLSINGLSWVDIVPPDEDEKDKEKKLEEFT